MKSFHLSAKIPLRVKIPFRGNKKIVNVRENVVIDPIVVYQMMKKPYNIKKSIVTPTEPPVEKECHVPLAEKECHVPPVKVSFESKKECNIPYDFERMFRNFKLSLNR